MLYPARFPAAAGLVQRTTRWPVLFSLPIGLAPTSRTHGAVANPYVQPTPVNARDLHTDPLTGWMGPKRLPLFFSRLHRFGFLFGLQRVATANCKIICSVLSAWIWGREMKPYFPGHIKKQSAGSSPSLNPWGFPGDLGFGCRDARAKALQVDPHHVSHITS